MSKESSNVAVMDKPVKVPQKTAVIENESESVTDITNSDITSFDSYVLTRSQKNFLTFKRAADFIISLILLIILAIPFAVIAVVQKLISPKEPVFFRQTRVGRNGQLFKVT